MGREAGDSSLAGLGFHFSPVSLKPAGGSVQRGRTGRGPSAGSSAGRSGGGGDRAPAGAVGSGGHKAVAFNLRERKPGAAYSSPEAASAQAPAPASRQQQQHPHAAAAAVRISRLPAGAAGKSSLAQLKLASLRRRAPAAAAASHDGAAAPPPAPPLLRAAVEAQAKETPSLPVVVEAGHPAPDPALAMEAVCHMAGDHAARLLQDAERLLAGCGSQVVEDPQPGLELPQHVQLGLPTLAVPPLAVPALAASTPAAAPAAGQNDRAMAAVAGEGGTADGLHCGRIPAHHPAPGCTAAQLAAEEQAAMPAACTAAEVEGKGDGFQAREAQQDVQPPPVTLEEALKCLGLLAQQKGAGHEGPAGTASGSGSSGHSSWASQVLERPAGAETPQWIRLRAVQLVVAAKQEAAMVELAPLVRRLRQVRLHLEYHKANLQSGRSRSPRRSTSPTPAAAPMLGPWLSGRSSAHDSKHRRSRSGSPGLCPRPKVMAPSAEASNLQVQLLGSLLHKLLLKLGLAVMQQLAGAARLRQRLLAHVSAQESARLCCAILLHWQVAAIPSEQQEAAAATLAAQLRMRRQRALLAEWRQWAARSAWQQRQLALARQQLQRRLLAAAVQHWRCYCQQQLVCRLQAALAARWVAAWCRRRVFVAWRQATRRSGQLKASLLLGRPCSSTTLEAPAPPPQLEALAATAAAFAPVRAFVSEAAQQLRQLRQGLRFRMPSSRYAAAAALEHQQRLTEEQERQGQEQEPLPVGSVESLLALVRAKQPPAAVTGLPAAKCSLTAQQTCSTMQLPWLDTHGAVVAAAGGGSSPDAVCVLGLAAGPAPDPGSPTTSFYNPASYTSPHKQQSREKQGLQRRRQQLQGRPLVHIDSAHTAEPPAVVEAELLKCQDQVQRLRQELEQLEKESADLQQQCTALEEAATAAEQAAMEQRETCTAADAGKEAAVAAMQDVVQQQAAAGAEFAERDRQLKQRQQESQDAMAVAAGARAAAHAAAERHALAAMAVQKWTKLVESAAKELAACHRSQQAPVMVRLKEARQQLERHQLEVEAAQQQMPELAAAAEAAARRAHQAQQAVLAAQQQLVIAAEQRSSRQQQLDAAMGQHEAAAVAAVAARQQASACDQQQRLLAAQRQAAVERFRQAAQQVQCKQQEAVALQQQVQLLQQRHQHAVAAMLAADESQLRKEQQQQQQQRGKLKRRLQAVQEEAGPTLPSPGAVQHRRPPPLAASSRQQSAGIQQWPGLALAAGAEANPDANAGRSCFSSELESTPHEVPSPPALTVDEAAERFYAHCLLRRALHIMRHEAERTRAALQAAAEWWQHRQQAAVLLAWHDHATEAAEWIFVASTVLRRRWLLRTWRAVVAGRRWQQEAEAAADAFARHRLLTAGVEAWRQHVRHEHWRDAMHEAVVQLRIRNMLQSWRRWTRRRRQKAACLRSALAVYHRRLLAAALQQWRWVQHSKALLHRVFSTAVDLWQEEVGARLHERNHERLQTCWGAWQLAVLEAQALRRQAILWNAAAAFREKQLLLAGLQAFKHALSCAREEQRLARLRAHMFAEWRRLAASSARHWEYEAARQHRQRRLLRAAVAAWHASAQATAEQLAHFWLRWQVRALLRRALLGWRWAAQAQREQRVLAGMAEVHRERRLLQHGLDAFSAMPARAGARVCQPQQSQQQPAGGQPLAVSVSVGGLPGQPHHRQQRLPGTTTTTTTVIISRGLPWEGQEQVPPGSAGSGGPAGRASCRIATSTTAPARETTAAAAAQGMLEAVSSWRAQADFWRQRHLSYSQPQQPQQPVANAAPLSVAVTPQTVATLAELRAQLQRQ